MTGERKRLVLLRDGEEVRAELAPTTIEEGRDCLRRQSDGRPEEVRQLQDILTVLLDAPVGTFGETTSPEARFPILPFDLGLRRFAALNGCFTMYSSSAGSSRPRAFVVPLGTEHQAHTVGQPWGSA